MAIDRQGTGLALLRICLGVFFFFEGVGKIKWLVTAAPLGAMLASWSQTASPGSVSHWYLDHVALPGLAVFARLVPIGELACGIALMVGFWTPVVAFVAFAMALNFQVASGAVFKYSFLTSGYGLPVLGGTLALILGGVRLPWSMRS